MYIYFYTEYLKLHKFMPDIIISRRESWMPITIYFTLCSINMESFKVVNIKK